LVLLFLQPPLDNLGAVGETLAEILCALLGHELRLQGVELHGARLFVDEVDQVRRQDVDLGSLFLLLLFLGALACGAVGAGSGYLVTINASQNDQIISAVAGFIIGVGIMCIVNATIVSCVKSLFMCFAMDPLVLYNTKQSQYDKLMAAWSRRWPEGIPCQAYIDVATQSPQQAYGQQQQYSQQAQYGQVQPGTMPGSPSHYTAYDHTYAPTGGGAQAAPPPPPPYNPYANNPNAA